MRVDDYVIYKLYNKDMKIGKNKLKMSNGTIRKFASEKKRNDFERVAEAYKHGWKPKKK